MATSAVPKKKKEFQESVSVFCYKMTMIAPQLHRYIYFYQSENALAFAATTSGAALVIDRTTARISLQRERS